MDKVETTVPTNGAELRVGTFGDREAPAILLIGGAAGSMDWWEPEFCERLAAGGRFVVRYDNRDTGQSTHYPPGAPGYTGEDLTTDAVSVLDGLGLPAAHIAGVSAGGGIAQELALGHPDRVASLILISTSPVVPLGSDSPSLPPMTDALAERFANPDPEPDWSDRAAVIQYFIDAERAFAGSLPVDAERIATIAGRAFDRSIDLAASNNHWALGGRPMRARLGEITAPTLVLHGTEDPLFPYGHGEALAAEIPGARLIPLARVGHQMPPPQVWDTVIPAMLEHTS